VFLNGRGPEPSAPAEPSLTASYFVRPPCPWSSFVDLAWPAGSLPLPASGSWWMVGVAVAGANRPRMIASNESRLDGPLVPPSCRPHPAAVMSPLDHARGPSGHAFGIRRSFRRGSTNHARRQKTALPPLAPPPPSPEVDVGAKCASSARLSRPPYRKNEVGIVGHGSCCRAVESISALNLAYQPSVGHETRVRKLKEPARSNPDLGQNGDRR